MSLNFPVRLMITSSERNGPEQGVYRARGSLVSISRKLASFLYTGGNLIAKDTNEGPRDHSSCSDVVAKT